MKRSLLFKPAYALPLLVFIWFIASFAVTYGISVYYKHVISILPFISDTGTYLPESAIFGQLLNIGAFIMVLSVYVRYLQVKMLTKFNRLNKFIKILNLACLYTGILISLGVSMVANFQETKMFTLHLIGAGFCLGFGLLFQIMQTVLCVFIYPRTGAKFINWLRIVMVGISFVCLVRCSPPYFVGLLNTDSQGRSITPNHPEYKSYLLDVLAEWIIILFTMIFILTFTYEFKNIKIYEPIVQTIT